MLTRLKLTRKIQFTRYSVTKHMKRTDAATIYNKLPILIVFCYFAPSLFTKFEQT